MANRLNSNKKDRQTDFSIIVPVFNRRTYLETAIDSSRPGFARALVSRDVRSYDGSRILIPRGSRLLGEYRADVTPGFLVTSPTYYTQVFTLPALPARATTLTIDFRYEILLLQAGSAPRDFEKRTATDTLVISRP